MTASDIQAMLARTSVRSYRDREIEPAALDALRGFVQRPRTGPFGNPVRFALAGRGRGRAGRGGARWLGTYGVIRGAPLYLASAVASAPHSMEDVGYCMEEAVILATRLGLGTCWLGGSFDRTGFARAAALGDGEVLPCVTPLGYGAGERGLLDRMSRALAGSDGRRPWGRLFFEGGLDRPMAEDTGDPVHAVLRCVRAAPSASNKQPWRIVRDASGVLHLFLARTRGYGRWFPGVDLQLIDMGIAMCHLSLAAAELGLRGSWKTADPGIGDKGLAYIASWTR